MRRSSVAALSLGLALTALGAAQAAPDQPYGMDRHSGNQLAPEPPHCDRPIGVAAIKEPDRDWWSPLGLSNPEAVLKMFALRSGCVRIVDRNQGLAMRNEEEDLSRGGELRRGSNVGRGQIVAADYFIIPDIARQNSNASGGGIGGMASHFLPGGWGAIAANINIHSSEANTLLTLVDARSTEQLYVAEGAAKKTDIGFGGGWGDWSGFGGVAAGGYTNTDIGKVIMAAYFNAFVDLIHYMQGQHPGSAEMNAAIAAQRTTTDVHLRTAPSTSAPMRYTVKTGALVYPTGKRDGIWMEVDDENGNRGWMSSAYATPR
ncbi:MAG: hypothetical protein JO127_14510 [Caulobacteraceae bacterium]|nr:hypothetical protein [Caulobacteraceae bacterium]